MNIDLPVECRYMNFIISVTNITGNTPSTLTYHREIAGYTEAKGLCKLPDTKIGIKFIIFMSPISSRKDSIIACEPYEGNGVQHVVGLTP